MNDRDFEAEQLKHSLALALEEHKAQKAAELEKYKYELNLILNKYLRDWDNRVNFSLKSHQSTIEYSMVAMRSLFIANGGAVIAILAFMGSLAKEGAKFLELLDPLSLSMAWFLGGVGAAILCAFFSYMAQGHYTVHGGAISGSDQEKTAERKGRLWTILAVIIGIVGFAEFACGVYTGIDAFKKYSKSQVQVEQSLSLPSHKTMSGEANESK